MIRMNIFAQDTNVMIIFGQDTPWCFYPSDGPGPGPDGDCDNVGFSMIMMVMVVTMQDIQ